MQPQDIKAFELLHEISHDLYWIIIPTFAFLLVKEIIIRWIDGILWRWRSEYNDHDVIRIEGDLARLEHIGWLNTEINIYEIEQGKIIGGWLLTVSNDQLRKMRIMKPLTKISEDMLTKYTKK